MIEPAGSDSGRELRSALEVLRGAQIKARQRSRSLQLKGLINVADDDAERALALLVASNIRASIRPN
jgi:hypothetical protein